MAKMKLSLGSEQNVSSYTSMGAQARSPSCFFHVSFILPFLYLLHYYLHFQSFCSLVFFCEMGFHSTAPAGFDLKILSPPVESWDCRNQLPPSPALSLHLNFSFSFPTSHAVFVLVYLFPCPSSLNFFFWVIFAWSSPQYACRDLRRDQWLPYCF